MDDQGIPLYRKHLGNAPEPDIESRDKYSRTRMVPPSQIPNIRAEGVQRSGEIPGYPSKDHDFAPGTLPHQRMDTVKGRNITYASNEQQTLDEALQRRRRVTREDYYEAGYAGDTTSITNRLTERHKNRLNLQEELIKSMQQSAAERSLARQTMQHADAAAHTANASTCLHRHKLGIINKEIEITNADIALVASLPE